MIARLWAALRSLRKRYNDFIERAQLAVKVFRTGLPRVPYVDTNGELADVLSGKRAPGFPCPECGHRITINIDQLLAPGAVVCAKCSLKLTLSWEEDARAREALVRLKHAAAEVEKAKTFRR